jgi:hypothetical protein
MKPPREVIHTLAPLPPSAHTGDPAAPRHRPWLYTSPARADPKSIPRTRVNARFPASQASVLSDSTAHNRFRRILNNYHEVSDLSPKLITRKVYIELITSRAFSFKHKGCRDWRAHRKDLIISLMIIPVYINHMPVSWSWNDFLSLSFLNESVQVPRYYRLSISPILITSKIIFRSAKQCSRLEH